MFIAKTRRMSSMLCMLIISVALIAPTFTAHIYASEAQTDELYSMAYQAPIEEQNISQQVAIKYSTLEIPTDEMFVGETRVSVEGRNGLIVKHYTVRYENGMEMSRVLVAEQLITKPIDRIVYVGTKQKTVPTLTGENVVKPASYKKYIDVSASAYDLSYASCGKYPGDPAYGITASGMRARVGVVAVDPRVIPLGTKLYIEAVDGSWTYGYAIAGDTGGAIKGNRVDLFFNTYNECIQFGRRNARVYILE